MNDFTNRGIRLALLKKQNIINILLATSVEKPLSYQEIFDKAMTHSEVSARPDNFKQLENFINRMHRKSERDLRKLFNGKMLFKTREGREVRFWCADYEHTTYSAQSDETFEPLNEQQVNHIHLPELVGIPIPEITVTSEAVVIVVGQRVKITVAI